MPGFDNFQTCANCGMLLGYETHFINGKFVCKPLDSNVQTPEGRIPQGATKQNTKLNKTKQTIWLKTKAQYHWTWI